MLVPVTWAGGVRCPPSTFRENVSINLARGLEEVRPRAAHGEELYIACAGPSLRDTAEELRGKRHVWALNGAHDYLVGRGILPTHGVCMAPEWEILRNFDRRAGAVYLFASQTHPALVDHILDRGDRVVLWHAHCPDEWGVEFGNRDTVFGGGTIGLRSLDLAWMLGFREVHCLGFDACLSDDDRIGPETPMYDDRQQDVQRFHVNGRSFRALPSHARQVEDVAATIRPLTGLYITWYGDGLMQWAMKGTA